jgi:peptidoglycan/LPS O-acetylase OafA/YrhL
MNNYCFGLIAKISYTGYLVHFAILDITENLFYEYTTLSTVDIVIFFIGNFALSVFFATLMTLLVEMPFANLENALLKGKAAGKS